MAQSKKKTKKTPVIRQGAKTAFVRSLPRSMPAAEVAERAAKKGMVMSTAYIHNIRSASSKRSRELTKGKKLVKGGKKTQEKTFCELVVTLGPARCKKLLEQTEGALIAAS